MNTSKLKSSKFIKLLRDSKLVNLAKSKSNYPIKRAEADLLFTKITSKRGVKQNASQGSMSFKDLVAALKHLSKKIYVTLEYPTGYLTLLNEHVLPLAENIDSNRVVGNEEIERLMKILKD
jgi:hypothetical protein